MGKDTAARKHVSLAGPHVGLLPLPTHRVDDDLAGPPPGRVGGGGDRRPLLANDGEEENGGHHLFGRGELPPTPPGRRAGTTLKARSPVEASTPVCPAGPS